MLYTGWFKSSWNIAQGYLTFLMFHVLTKHPVHSTNWRSISSGLSSRVYKYIICIMISLLWNSFYKNVLGSRTSKSMQRSRRKRSKRKQTCSCWNCLKFRDAVSDDGLACICQLSEATCPKSGTQNRGLSWPQSSLSKESSTSLLPPCLFSLLHFRCTSSTLTLRIHTILWSKSECWIRKH